MSENREPKLRDRWERTVRADPAVTGTTLLVALVMATYSDRDGRSARPGVARVMEDVGASDRTVRRALTALTTLGYLEEVSRGHRPWNAEKGTGVASEYALALPVTGDLLRPVDNHTSTGHQRPEESRPTARSTGHPRPLNRSSEPSQPVTHDRLQGETRMTRGEAPLYPQQCSKHQHGPHEEPCGGCAGARRAHAETTARTERDQARSLRTAPRCTEHPHELASSCSGCASDHKVGDHRAAPSGACHLCNASRAAA